MKYQPSLLENWIFLVGCWIFPSRLSSLRLYGSARGFEFISRAEPQRRRAKLDDSGLGLRHSLREISE